jgi:hypothetical protein
MILAATLLGAACGSPAAPDAYDLLSASTKGVWDPLQINVGVVVKDGDTTITIEPTAMAMVVDGAGNKSGIHIALPAESLGLNPFMLDQLGIDGDSIDFDVIYDGQNLYARSALLGTSLRMLLGPSGKVPPGNLAGWLAFGSAADFAALSNLMGAAPTGPSAGPSGDGSAGSLKAALEEIGITLTSAGTEKRAGTDALHLTVAIDTAKLFASQYFDAATRAQLGQLGVPVQAITVSGDIWIDQAANRVVELDVHVGSTAKAAQTGDITVTFRDPDGSVSLAAPGSSVDVPIGILIAEMMKLLSNGAES